MSIEDRGIAPLFLQKHTVSRSVISFHRKIWNSLFYRIQTFIEMGRSGQFEDFRKHAEDALGNLYAAIETAEQRLRDIREELGRKHGQPYVTKTPSFGTEYSMDRFFR